MSGLAEYDSIIFDFDGVLAESVDVKTRAFAALYREYGKDIVEQVVAYHLANGGMSRYEKIRYYQERLLFQRADEATVMTMAERFGKMAEEEVIASPPVAGAPELLASLNGRASLFVVSATPEEELHRILRHRGMFALFKEARGSPRSKADNIRDLVHGYGLDVDRTVMIGDAINDFVAAQAAGVAFIGRVVEGNENPFPSYIRIVPDLLALTRLERQAEQ